MLFGKRSKASFSEEVYANGEHVADLELNGGGKTKNGRQLWGFRTVNGSIPAGKAKLRGREISVDEYDESTGAGYLEIN